MAGCAVEGQNITCFAIFMAGIAKVLIDVVTIPAVGACMVFDRENAGTARLALRGAVSAGFTRILACPLFIIREIQITVRVEGTAGS